MRVTDPHQRTVRGHTPLTLLMSPHTVSTPWLLSLPLVTES